MSGTEGRRGSFEVVVNGELVYSKLKTGKFPEDEDVVEACLALKKGESVPQIRSKLGSNCSVM